MEVCVLPPSAQTGEDMAKLKGEIALIAGGAWDINLLVAKQFIKEGAHVSPPH